MIEATDKLIEGFESVATATGFTVLWTTMMDLAGGLDNEVMQIVAYDEDGRATQIDRFVVPAPNTTDASTIAAQERRLLQTLYSMRGSARPAPGACGSAMKGRASAMSMSPWPSWTVGSPRPGRGSHGSSRPPRGMRCPGQNTGRA